MSERNDWEKISFKQSAQYLLFETQTESFWSQLFDLDVDECAENRDRCRNGLCTNTQGGYFCTCNEGYELTPDKSTCVGKYMYFIHLVLWLTC